jgi:hypothetical protein
VGGEGSWLTNSIPYKWARRIVITLIGGTVCLIGVAMIVLPGPALVVIPVGLGILGLEFAWARRWLGKVREAADGLVNGMRNSGIWQRRLVDRHRPGPPPVD